MKLRLWGLPLPTAWALAAVVTLCVVGQENSPRHSIPKEPTATVEVRVYREDDGKFLGSPNVNEFKSDGGKNFASRFHSGVAEGIPCGTYSLSGSLVAYTAIGGFISVYQPRVTVVRGMAVGYELPEFPYVLRGRVIGTPPLHSFVRIVGIYGTEMQDSAIGSDGSFSFGGIVHGNFLLFVVSESSSVLAIRRITVPPKSSPLEIQIGRDSQSSLK